MDYEVQHLGCVSRCGVGHGNSVPKPFAAIRSDISSPRSRPNHWPTTISLPGKALDLRPQFLEAFLPHQFLKLTASAEFGVKFLRDQSAQRVETILTAGMPVALCFQKLLGS